MISTQRAFALLATVLVVTSTVGVTTATAGSADSDISDALLGSAPEEDVERGLLASVTHRVTHPVESLESFTDSATAWLTETHAALKRGWYETFSEGTPWHEPVRTDAECAEDIHHELNQHSAAYTTYVNDRITASESRDVLRITCRLGENETSVIATADVVERDGQLVYENFEVQQPSATERVVDEEIVLTGLATEELPDDLEAFTDEYVEANETPERTYAARKGAQYNGFVYGTFDFLESDSEAE
ncbi:hypothetical protein [Halomarina oriensis]|uniref:Uncharacterized protein n=1 Tax=Halomarina oriensis TaxID=671145 RepID=A0A6B0GWV2_9EURY|nr:hypothetical protein [Halomarina oriensis]MWG36238.1 hypothetical protein [Halomarina oriensis]